MGEATTTSEPRERVNAKQTSKGDWYFEATVERFDGGSPAARLTALVIETETAFTAAGKKLVTAG